MKRSQERKQEAAKTRTDLLFKDFSLYWGSKWISSLEEHGYERLNQVWTEETIELTEEEFKQAIISCRRNCPFPPTISEFLRAAYSFRGEHDAFNVANSESYTNLSQELDSSQPQNIVLLRARWAVREVFNRGYNNRSDEENRKIWSKQYKQEIEDFLSQPFVREEPKPIQEPTQEQAPMTQLINSTGATVISQKPMEAAHDEASLSEKRKRELENGETAFKNFQERKRKLLPMTTSARTFRAG